MCVICEFEDSYLIYKIFVVDLIADCYLQCSKKCSVNTNKDASLKYRLQEARMLAEGGKMFVNAIQQL